MKTLEVNIDLDPVNDGASVINVNIKKEDEDALIIATDGKKKRIGPLETMDLLIKLRHISHGEFMGKSPYIMIINADKIFKLETGSYFIGSALILKDDGTGLGPLSEEDFAKAETEFVSRLVTLTGNGQDYSAYELI